MTKFFTSLSFLMLYVSILTAQTTYTVCASGCNFTTITAAIGGAINGDIISITDAVHTEQGIVVDKDLTIQSGNTGTAIIQAHAQEEQATNRVFLINTGITVMMNDLTIRNGLIYQTASGPGGGGILNNGTLSLMNCTISGNFCVASLSGPSHGGGIYNSVGATLTITNCTISGNTSLTHSSNQSQGAGICNHSNEPSTITNSTISGNSCASFSSGYTYGGGIYNENGESLTITNCTISGNTSSSDFGISLGGAIYNSVGSLTMINTIIAKNTAQLGPNFAGTVSPSINNICESCQGTSWLSTADPFLGTLSNNGGPTQTIAILNICSPAVNNGTATGAPTLDQIGQARIGAIDIGAFEFQQSSLAPHTVCSSGCGFTTITAAIATACSGDTILIMDAVHTEQGIVIDKDLIIQSGILDGTIVQAHAQPNMATDRVFYINSGLMVTMNGLTIQHGNTTESGGGIYNGLGSTLIQTNCKISDNTGRFGGGIYNNNNGTLTQTNCIISGNSGYSGGGIYNIAASLTQINCTTSGNSVTWRGGGIANQNASLTQTNCTISENSADHNSGGFYHSLGSTLIQTNCTVSGNSANYNGGIFSEGNSQFINTIIADNFNNASSSDPNFRQFSNPSITNSICEDCTGAWTSTADPMLGVLANNGGTAQTVAIACNSPAINAGTSTGAPTADQIGQARVGAVDIGAYEYQENPPQITGIARPGAGYTLDFEEDNSQSVLIPYHASLNLGNTFSFEAWVNLESYTSGIGAIISMPSSATGSGVRFGIRTNGVIDFITNAGGIITGIGAIGLAEWVHLAGTYDGTNFRLYKNGVLLATQAVTYTTSAYTQPLFIGVEGSSGVIADRHFDGQLDEIRIWNSTLSETAIKDWMCRKINDSHSNFCDLVSYYRFDENTGTTLTDYIGDNDGTLINAPVWETSGAAVGEESTHDYNGNATSITQSHSDGSSFTINNFTGTPDGAHVYLINEAPKDSTDNLNGTLEASRYYGTYIVGGTTPSYTATYDYSNNTNIEGTSNEVEAKLLMRSNTADWDVVSNHCDIDTSTNDIVVDRFSASGEYIVGFGSKQNLERPSSGYALDFNGTDQYIDLPNGLTSNFNDFTFETWFYTNANASWARLLDFGSSTTVNMFLTPSYSVTNIPRFAITTNGNLGEQQLTAPTALVQNKWYHIAVTIDDASNTGTMYINGVQVAQNTSMTLTPSSLGITTNNYLGKSQYDDPYLNGEMDEVRIWNKALSQSEIRDWMCKKVEDPHPQICNLISYYRFDEGTGTTLVDLFRHNDGNLMNAPTWKMSSAPLGDESIYTYNAVAVGTTINLAHANGDQMTMTVTNGTAEGIQLYRVDEAANSTVPSAGLDYVSIINHWGAKVFGGSIDCEYTVVYNYAGHPGISVPSELRLLSRANNAAEDWTETPAILNESLSTLTLEGQTGTQFVLGSGGSNNLPIELLSFDAQVIQKFVQLDWRTSSETNNDYFEIQRSPFGNNWTTLERIKGQGTTSSESIYKHYDKTPLEGTAYYRLKQVDLDGTFSYSQTRTIVFSSKEEELISIFPNPAKGQVNVLIHTASASTIKINLIDLQGQTVQALDHVLSRGANQLTLPLDGLAAGLYFISIQQNNKVINKKFLIGE